MRYQSFRVSNFKGIVGSIDIPINYYPTPMTPIIGLNGTGKSSILEAIASIDPYSWEKSLPRQILPRRLDPDDDVVPIVEAEVELDHSLADDRALFNELQSETFVIARYGPRLEQVSITSAAGANIENVRQVVQSHLPRIVPIFRDLPVVPDSIDVSYSAQSGKYHDRQASLLERMATRSGYSVSIHALGAMDEMQRGRKEAQLSSVLTTAIANSWMPLIDEKPSNVRVQVSYDKIRQTKVGPSQVRNAPYLDVWYVENSGTSEENRFRLSELGSGFSYFVSFIVELLGSDELLEHSGSCNLVLMDEPALALHSTGQEEWLVLVKDFLKREGISLVYTTHSEHLITPNVVPPTSVLILSRDGYDGVAISTVDKSAISSRATVPAAARPIYDALKLRPGPFEFRGKMVVLFEGFAEFLAWTLLYPNDDVVYFPCHGAGDVRRSTKYFLANGYDFRAVWDNDDEGRKEEGIFRKAIGDSAADRHARLLEGEMDGTTRVEELIGPRNMDYLREKQGMERKAKAIDVLSPLFYSDDSRGLIVGLPDPPHDRFANQFRQIE